jgi:hypothetical protein
MKQATVKATISERSKYDILVVISEAQFTPTPKKETYISAGSTASFHTYQVCLLSISLLSQSDSLGTPEAG